MQFTTGFFVVPEPVEAVIGPVDGEDGGAGVGLGHAPVPLEDDDLGPDLVVDGVPLAHHLCNVVLKREKEREDSLRVFINTEHFSNRSRLKKFEVACLVDTKSKLDYGMSFSNENMMENMYFFTLSSIHNNEFYFNVIGYFPKDFSFYL